jgi:ribosomal protein S18 acetylase RimI-like enzyme
MLDPRVRSAGLGSQVLDQVVQIIREYGGTAMYIAVLERNPAAQRFWMRNGFVERWQQDATAHSGQVNHVIGMMRIVNS